MLDESRHAVTISAGMQTSMAAGPTAFTWDDDVQPIGLVETDAFCNNLGRHRIESSADIRALERWGQPGVAEARKTLDEMAGMAKTDAVEPPPREKSDGVMPNSSHHVHQKRRRNAWIDRGIRLDVEKSRIRS